MNQVDAGQYTVTPLVGAQATITLDELADGEILIKGVARLTPQGGRGSYDWTSSPAKEDLFHTGATVGAIFRKA